MPKIETLNPIERNCRACETAFSISPDEQKRLVDKGFEFPTHCPGCRQKKHSVATITCKDCNEPFELTELEGDSYERKGFPIPKRCPKCRKKRKEASGK